MPNGRCRPDDQDGAGTEFALITGLGYKLGAARFGARRN